MLVPRRLSGSGMPSRLSVTVPPVMQNTANKERHEMEAALAVGASQRSGKLHSDEITSQPCTHDLIAPAACTMVAGRSTMVI